MDSSYDKQKIIDSMFDPITSQILAELENDGKDVSHLAQITSLSESEIFERMSYLMEHGFISKKTDNGKTYLYADGKKLSSLVESGDSFDGAIDGLTKIDSYLN